MADLPTLFKMPNTPDEFGVVLPESNLRKLDFSGLDYTTCRRAIIEYIKTYYPNDFNDFVASNGVMMIMEIVSSVVGKLSLRGDILANESTLPTAQTEEAVVNHLALIAQRIKRQTPSTVDIEISVDQPIFSDIEIDPGMVFTVNGPDNAPIYYEIYRTPSDWLGKIIIPANKRGIIAYGLEGKFSSPIEVISNGDSNQKFVIQDSNILESPISITIAIGDVVEKWKVITEPIERYGPVDKVVEVNFIKDTAVFRFGDNVTGQIPVSGSTITILYRTGGGIRGRIGANMIDTTRDIVPLPPSNSSTTVRFRNISASSGGFDRESIEQAKKRAPRDYSLQSSIVGSSDYAQAVSSFSHPVFGSVSKAVATINSDINANLVQIYCLSTDYDGLPVAPSSGLKDGLITYLNDLNVLTDYVKILDGAIKPVDIDITVIISRNADASVVKTKVDSAVSKYFNIDNWEIGHPFYLSDFIENIKRIDGISYIDVHKPLGNILQTGLLADPLSDGVGYNELIVEGSKTINYYYERNQTVTSAKNVK